MKKYAWLLLVLIGALIGWYFTGRNPKKILQAENKRIDTEREVLELQALSKYDAAIELVHQKYAEEKKALDDDSLAHAEELAGDPIALARFLAHAGVH